MHDKLFLFLGRGSEQEGRAIRIQSSAAWKVFCILQCIICINATRPALTTMLIREQEEITSVLQNDDPIQTHKFNPYWILILTQSGFMVAVISPSHFSYSVSNTRWGGFTAS